MAKKRLILAVLLLGAGLVVLCLWLLPPKQPIQIVTLASGSTVTFARVDYGKKRVFEPDGSWSHKLAFLPDSLLKRLKMYPGLGIPVESNHMVIWFYVTPQRSTDLFNSSANPFSLVDENGVESFSPSFWPYSFSPATGSTGKSGIGVDVGTFPRRSKDFRMRFYSKDAARKLTLRGEMKIPNPAYGKYPEWTPEPLPVTKTNGGVAITLTQLSTGMSMFSSEPAATNEESWGRACFTFAQDGKPCRDWAVDFIEFSDATGNHAQPTAWNDEGPKSSQDVFNFRAPLWPAESAWNLNVAFKRKPSAKFAPGELWSITNIALPALNATNVLNLETNLNGVKVKFLSLTDESSTLPAETLKSDRCVRLSFYVPPLPAGMRFEIVSVTGTLVRTEDYSGGLQSYDYMVPVSAGTLDAKVAVYRQLAAQFTVKPSIAAASNSVSKIK